MTGPADGRGHADTALVHGDERLVQHPERAVHQHQSRQGRTAALALRASGGSVLTSALILSLAGYAEGLMSKIDAISTIGMLLGRGAALSGILVLTLLPVLLTVFDPVIMSTTLGTKLIRHKEKRSA